jgi:cell division septal protein FtsQ
MSDEEPVKAIGAEATPEEAAATPPKPRKRRKKAPPPKPPTAREALVSLGEQIRAARRQAKATERVGWGLFRDDVRRGRIIDLTGLALLVALAITFATSPDYQVQSVTVVNSKVLTDDQAARLTGVLGTNIFMVDAKQVVTRLRQSPFIKSATVETTLPGQVLIHVDERRPNVVWVLIDNTPYLISDDGVIISQATTLQGYIVVYDKDTTPGSLHFGDKLERQDVIDVAQQLYMKLPGASGLHISQMEYAVAGGVTVVTDTGRRVQFGDGAQLDLKIRVVTALINDLTAQKQDWHLIDVRSPDRVSLVK